MSTRASDRLLRPLPNVDYYIPGDDVHHHRHHSPSPHRDRRSASRSRSRARDTSAPAAARQPLFEVEGASIAEEDRDEAGLGQHGQEDGQGQGQVEAALTAASADSTAEDAADTSRQGELSQEDDALEFTERDEDEAEAQAAQPSSLSSRRKSTRSKRSSDKGDKESSRAKLRRRTTELVESAAQLLTGKRATRASKHTKQAPHEDSHEANGTEHVEEEEGEEQQDGDGAADQPGQAASEQQQSSASHQGDEENDQPEGTPAKARRRTSRSSQVSRSPLRALASMLPASVTSRLSVVSEDAGMGAAGKAAADGHHERKQQDRQQQDRQQQHASQRSEAETNEAGAEGDANEVRKAPFTTLSLFDWRWLLPGLLVALLASLALLQLFHPHLLPTRSSWLSSSDDGTSHFPARPSSMAPLHDSDWRRLSASFLPVAQWESFKARWERWIEDDTRRAAEIVDAVKEWVEAKLHKVEQRSSSSGSTDVSELRSELSKRLSEARAGWLHEVDGLIEQRLASALTDGDTVRQADVQRAVAELRTEMRQRVADELQRGTDELLNTVRSELENRMAPQADDSERRAAQWQSRLTDEVSAVERRAVDAALAAVDSRFVSNEQLHKMDEAIRRYIRDTLAAQAEQYATAEQLGQVERRVMAAIQQRASGKEGAEDKLSVDDKKRLVAEVMQAARAEWAAEKERMKVELRESLLQEASDQATKQHSGAVGQLKKQLAELEQRLISSQSKEEEVSRSTHQWVEQRLQSALEAMQGGGSTQLDVTKKLAALDAALEELKAATSQASQAAAAASSSSRPASASASSTLSDIAAALELFAADRTNQVDYALASSGGRIVAHSPTHPAAAALSSASASFPASVLSPLLSALTSRHLPSVPAEALLDADMSVGHCWPMAGRSGGVIIALRERLAVGGLTLQHASVAVLPDGGASMPRRLRLSGLDDDQLREARRQVAEPTGAEAGAEQQPAYVGAVLGEFEYVRGASQVQQWSIDSKGANGRGYQYVRLDVLSNYGNSNYTCLYRVRVHGEPVRES